MNKLYLLLGGVMLLLLLIIPLTATPAASVQPAAAGVAVAAQGSTAASQPRVRVRRSEGGRIEQLSVSEYLIGVAAAEMSMSYEDEALCAQIVAAHTLLQYRTAENKALDYDITDSSKTDQSYIDRSQRAERFGENAEQHEQRLIALVERVGSRTVTYKDQPILAVYHAISGGRTESAANMWGGDYPYLQPVESVSDLLSPQFASTVTYTAGEFAALAKKLGVSPDQKQAVDKWIGAAKCTASGTVMKLKLCGSEFSGAKLREAFGLRSANFDLKATDGKLVFTVRGYGHGVGMSQFGANELARGGSSYEEILLWYYKGCKIQG